jgi:hypothetical protein
LLGICVLLMRALSIPVKVVCRLWPVKPFNDVTQTGLGWAK